MLEHTRTQTTGALTEIRFAVPSSLADDFFAAINGMLRVANLPPAQTVDMIPVEQVIPESSPGFRLRGLRTREGLTQKQLAEALGSRQHHVSEMEKGKRAISMEMAKKIGEIYNISYKVFL